MREIVIAPRAGGKCQKGRSDTGNWKMARGRVLLSHGGRSVVVCGMIRTVGVLGEADPSGLRKSEHYSQARENPEQNGERL